MSELLLEYPQPSFQCVPRGGATRAQSVLGGLRCLQEQGVDPTDWVLVHDAARCLITPRLVQALLQACAKDSVGGLLALPLPDTLKASVGGRVSATLSRSDKWLAQTPQMFRLGALALALEQPSQDITDEASAMEAKGHTPLLVEGASFNFKVTYPQDWALAEAVLNDRQHRPGVLS
jgi:2-C-methyl-D-erythritol 4-phosphate cytidylyltransferase